MHCIQYKALLLWLNKCIGQYSISVRRWIHSHSQGLETYLVQGVFHDCDAICMACILNPYVMIVTITSVWWLLMVRCIFMSWWSHQMETFSALLAICAVWINDWVNKREPGDLRRHRGYYDVNVMWSNYLFSSELLFWQLLQFTWRI